MSSFDVKYPKDGGLILPDGGLNTKYPRAFIPDNETPDALNVVFNNGAPETRGGSSYVNSSTLGTFACDGLFTRHDRSGAETMVAFFGGLMYTLDGVATFATVPSAQSVFTAGVDVCGVEYENKLFLGNGSVSPYKWDGTYFTRHGVPAPSSAPAAASGSAGSLSGTFSFKVAYINSGSVVGDIGPAVTFGVASKNIVLSGIPTAPASYGVNARRIYLATAATYSLLAELNDNTSTTYTVTTETVSSPAPTDAGEPPNYSAAIYHKDRLFCNDPANENFFWYSDLGEPYTFTSTNFDTAGDNTSDKVRGFELLGDHLVVICAKSSWLIYMPSTTPSDWKKIRIKTSYGSRSPYAFVSYNGKVLFPAVESDNFVGFAAIAGDALAPSATFLTVSTAGSDLQSDKISPDMDNVQDGYLAKMAAITYKSRAFIAVPYGSGATYNNRVYVYDYSISNLKKKQEGAWIPFTGWNAGKWTIYNGNLYYGSSDTAGRVYRALIEGTYNDSGAAIDSYIWTKEFAGIKGHEDAQKDFRKLNLYYETAGNYFMSAAYRTDGDSGAGNELQIDLNPGGSLWGSMIFGIDLWGGGKQDDLINQSLGAARGKRIQFKFSNQNTVNQKFKVSGFNFQYNVKGRR